MFGVSSVMFHVQFSVLAFSSNALLSFVLVPSSFSFVIVPLYFIYPSYAMLPDDASLAFTVISILFDVSLLSTIFSLLVSIGFTNSGAVMSFFIVTLHSFPSSVSSVSFPAMSFAFIFIVLGCV